MWVGERWWVDQALCMCAKAGTLRFVADSPASCLSLSLQQLDPWQARSHQTLGQAYEAAGKAEAAMDSYNTALALDPSNASTLLSLGE